MFGQVALGVDRGGQQRRRRAIASGRIDRRHHFAPSPHADQFINVRDRPFSRAISCSFASTSGSNERDLAGVVPLLVLAEAEQVRLVLGTPAVEVEAVLGDDRLAELLGLFHIGIEGAIHPPVRHSPASPSATCRPSIVRRYRPSGKSLLAKLAESR